MNKIALYPGSFDPITKGHLNIIKRASHLFDNLIVGVFMNSSKNYWFESEERKQMIEEVLKAEKIDAKVKVFDGLLVDFIKNEKIDILLRGLRAVSDYEYELQFTLTNETLAKSEFETIFLSASVALFIPLMPAGSSAGPTIIKSLYIKSILSVPKPS